MNQEAQQNNMKYLAAGQALEMGLYHSIRLSISLGKPAEDFESLIEQKRNAQETYQKELNRIVKEFDFPESAVNQIILAVEDLSVQLGKSMLSHGRLVSSRHEELQPLLDWLILNSKAEFLRKLAPSESHYLELLKEDLLKISSQFSLIPHEQAHLQLSCASSAQSYLNWTLLTQASLIFGYTRKSLAAGFQPRAPLRLRQDDEPDIERGWGLRKVIWNDLEGFLRSLAGVEQTHIHEALRQAAAAEDLFNGTVRQHGIDISDREAWTFALNYAPLSCPVDNRGTPYGITAIQEGYASVHTDSTLGVSYADLQEGRQNSLYHGIYHQLPAFSAKYLGLRYPDSFRYTFLAICDIAMSSHIHPFALRAFERDFSSTWHDLHPGWRFHRCLEITREKNLAIFDPDKDYNQTVSSLCSILNWPEPQQVADVISEDNSRLQRADHFNPMLSREKIMRDLRRDQTWTPIRPSHDVNIDPVFFEAMGGGFFDFKRNPILTEDSLATVTAAAAVELARKIVCDSNYSNLEIPFVRKDSIAFVYERLEEMFGKQPEWFWRPGS